MTTSANEQSLGEPAFFAQLAGAPDTRAIVDALLAVWPEHVGYCEARFRNFDASFEARMNTVSKLVLANVGDELPGYCEDYRWMCDEFLAEEIYFRRHDKYRLSTFEDAFREVYSKPNYMGRYVRGILISQIIWEPHARAFDFFRTVFLKMLPAGSSYVEVGPGHGLFLYFASQVASIARLEAWDVSHSSIAETKSALRRLGVGRDIAIVEQDVLKAVPNPCQFDGAVISEVLEHLEQPGLALQTLHGALKTGGRIFINAPINSPAPDHIYLWSSTDEFVDFVKAHGFEIEHVEFFAVTGATLHQAVRKRLSVSCIVIGRKV